MRHTFITLLVCCAAAPAVAASYPVSGKWAESHDAGTGAIDCTGRRVVEFRGERRFDSGGGVPEYRSRQIVAEGDARFRITDEFNTGQIASRLTYILQQIEADRIALIMQRGGTLTLRRW